MSLFSIGFYVTKIKMYTFIVMKNYSRKMGKKLTRYRTPSSFRVRKAESAKRMKLSSPLHRSGMDFPADFPIKFKVE